MFGCIHIHACTCTYEIYAENCDITSLWVSIYLMVFHTAKGSLLHFTARDLQHDPNHYIFFCLRNCFKSEGMIVKTSQLFSWRQLVAAEADNGRLPKRLKGWHVVGA
jgi:hypothetical protein